MKMRRLPVNIPPQAQGAQVEAWGGWLTARHGMGVPLPLHLRDALREIERSVVHLRVFMKTIV